VGTFNFSAKYLSKKDSSTRLPELTEFVPATRMGIVRKVLLGLKIRAGCILPTRSSVEFRRKRHSRNDRSFAHLHIQNGGSKRIWILTPS
jgi:hypothetical protein